MTTHQSRDQRPLSLTLQMALLTFGVLALELALIRWIGSQIRVAAYFANLILLATFTGLGLGVALARRFPRIEAWCLPTLAVLSVVLATSRWTGLMDLSFPDPAIAFWSGPASASTAQFAFATVAMAVCFWAVAAVFIPAGAGIGRLFAELDPLTAYGADIAGSLLGVIAMAFVAWLGAPPPVWLVLAVLPFVVLRRSATTALAAVIAVAAGAISIDGALFSPYNRVDLKPGGDAIDVLKPVGSAEWTLSVNRDYHQYLLDLSNRSAAVDSVRARAQSAYELPFRLPSGSGNDALIVGAGGGNDVAAALRRGFERVASVDIDSLILRIGQELHPEKPYDDPRVTRIVNDARAYFEQDRKAHYAVVCYGLLDSHAMFSAMTSLRLDNYVYTVEGLRAGWEHVREDGLMSVSFSIFEGEWMQQRIYRTMKAATGLDPIFVFHGYNRGGTFLVGRNLTLADVAREFPSATATLRPFPEIHLPVDDWPFLYLRPNTVPWAYLAVFALIVLSGVAAIRGAYGNVLSRSRFDLQMFLLGAGFMLLETRMVTQLSLLFGSTWIVNTTVFGGILLMILLANATVRWRGVSPALAYGGLGLSILAIWALPPAALSALSQVERLLVAGPLFALPVYFAGLIFSGALRDRHDVPAALGSNLCGAVLGGMVEYSSMLFGMRATALLALGLYACSMLAAKRGQAEAPKAPA